MPLLWHIQTSSCNVLETTLINSLMHVNNVLKIEIDSEKIILMHGIVDTLVCSLYIFIFQRVAVRTSLFSFYRVHILNPIETTHSCWKVYRSHPNMTGIFHMHPAVTCFTVKPGNVNFTLNPSREWCIKYSLDVFVTETQLFCHGYVLSRLMGHRGSAQVHFNDLMLELYHIWVTVLPNMHNPFYPKNSFHNFL